MLTIFSVSAITAQETSNKKEIVVEYTFVDSADIIIYFEMAKGDNKISRFFVLEDIEYDIKRKSVYTNDYVMYVSCEALKLLAFEGTVNTADTADYKIQDFPLVRRKAVKLLGQLGTTEAKLALIEVLKHEHDTFVLNEAIRALFLNKSDINKNEDKTNILFNAIINKLKNVNAHPIVGGTKISYDKKKITLKKGDDILTVNLDQIMTGSSNVLYQYIDSSYNKGYFYFLFFAKSWWNEIPIPTGEWGAGEIKTAFIIKINLYFDKYEIINQYLSQLEPQEYMITSDGFKRNGTIFYWFLMGSIRKEDNRSEIYRIVSIDTAKLEEGFTVNEYKEYELMYEYWFNNIKGDEINGINNKGEFIFFDDLE